MRSRTVTKPRVEGNQTGLPVTPARPWEQQTKRGPETTEPVLSDAGLLMQRMGLAFWTALIDTKQQKE